MFSLSRLPAASSALASPLYFSLCPTDYPKVLSSLLHAHIHTYIHPNLTPNNGKFNTKRSAGQLSGFIPLSSSFSSQLGLVKESSAVATKVISLNVWPVFSITSDKVSHLHSCPHHQCPVPPTQMSTPLPNPAAPGTPLLDPRGEAAVEDDIEEICRTLDKSRKRHLSVGLLRGDQVQDRLRVQEASASPLLKKGRTSVLLPPQLLTPVNEVNKEGKMALTMADFEAYMERNTNKRLGGIETGLSGLRSSVDKLETAVATNTGKIDAHEKIIRENQGGLAELKLQLTRGHFPALPSSTERPASWSSPVSAGAPPMTNPADAANYDRARRTIRMWPILGSSENELWGSVCIFLRTTLALTGQVSEAMIDCIRRAPQPSGPAVRDEVLVVFKLAATRDLVMGASSKLAPYMDGEGRSTAGLRMEVPQHLQQHFKVLFRYGQNLRARHGPGTRRHVKFDDVERTLFLNAKLPGDESWSRVSYEVAKRGLRAREIQSNGDLERRMDITGARPPQDRQRAASVSSAAPQPMEIWTGRRSESTSS